MLLDCFKRIINLAGLVLIPSLSLSAQLIDHKPFWIETTPYRFNPDVIAQQKIHRVVVSMQEKLDDFPIENKGLHDIYEFDKLGLVTRFIHLTIRSRELVEIKVPAVYNSRGRKIKAATTRDEYVYTFDTTFTWFRYDEHRRLIMRRTHQGDYFFTWYYDYNQNGFLSRQTYCRETSKNPDIQQFELGVQTIISTESFDYIFQTASQLRKAFLNDEGKEYRSAIINFSKFFVEENHSYTVGFVKYYNLYTFNEQGLPAESKTSTNANGDISFRTLYEYDQNGVLSGEKRFRDTVHTNNVTWLYTEQSPLVKARLDRDLEKKKIGIVKFSYEFY
ncbi:MAG: hypothetical protein IT233_05900 [Bacteroidia bacterium]|nr:hypothetical protein [Bacteroidia bacterium]